MDDAKRKLAECWRDLAGWHKGMVNEFGHVCDEAKDGYASFSDAPHSAGYGAGAKAAWVLPDPDAPSNWGVWLAWYAENCPDVLAWVLNEVGQHVECLPQALLDALAHSYEWDDKLGDLPPSVQAWWAEQQEARHG